MKVESWEITRPIPYSRNPRRNEGAIAKVAGSLKEFGWRQPIVVDTEGVIIAGHTRLLAAQKLGLSQVPVHIATDLSPQQIKAYRLADNRVAQEAEWDNDLLKLELSELDEEGFSLDLTGFNEDELEALLAEGTEDGLTDEDETPEVEEEAITLEGDLWILGKHRLRCGDSTNPEHILLLMQGEKASFAIADPPYNVGYSYATYDDNKSEEDYKRFCNIYTDNALNHAPAMATTPGKGNEKYYIQRLDYQTCAIWHKGFSLTPGSWVHAIVTEPILFFGTKPKSKRYPTDYFEQKTDREKELGDKHTCPKPVELWRQIIEPMTETGDIVLEMFGGSGTTAIVCEKIGRKARLIEIDIKYCDVIVKRWQQFTGKEAILESSGKTFAEVEAERKA